MVVLFFIFYKIKKPKFLIIGITASFVLLLLIFNIPFVKSRFAERPSLKYEMSAPHWSSWNGLTLRFAEWKCSLDVIKDNFFIGVGIGDSEDKLLESYKNNSFEIGYVNKWNSHNEYLQTFLSLGFLGFLVLMLMLLYPLIISLKKNDFVYFLFILITLVCFTTESMLSVQKGVVFFSFFNSLFAFSNKNNIG